MYLLSCHPTHLREPAVADASEGESRSESLPNPMRSTLSNPPPSPPPPPPVVPLPAPPVDPSSRPVTRRLVSLQMQGHHNVQAWVHDICIPENLTVAAPVKNTSRTIVSRHERDQKACQAPNGNHLLTTPNHPAIVIACAYPPTCVWLRVHPPLKMLPPHPAGSGSWGHPAGWACAGKWTRRQALVHSSTWEKQTGCRLVTMKKADPSTLAQQIHVATTELARILSLPSTCSNLQFYIVLATIYLHP
jgi:hypothetical protein